MLLEGDNIENIDEASLEYDILCSVLDKDENVSGNSDLASVGSRVD